MALCYDDHHRTHLGPFLVERAVEAMLGCNSLVFNNEALLARARQLRLADTEGKKGGKADKDLEEDKEEGGKEDEEGKKNEGKKVGKKAPRKRKQKPSSDSDSDSSSSSTDAKEGSPKKKKKKKA